MPEFVRPIVFLRVPDDLSVVVHVKVRVLENIPLGAPAAIGIQTVSFSNKVVDQTVDIEVEPNIALVSVDEVGRHLVLD